MPRDLNAEPTFQTPDIQGDILAGLPKRCELLLFFKIQDPKVFKAFLKTLHITSMEECLAQRDLIKRRKEAGIETLVPTPGLNVAFTHKGLTKLGVEGIDGKQPALEAFRDGMAARTEKGALTDPDPATWNFPRPGHRPDGVFILTGASEAEIADTVSLRLAPVRGNGWRILHEELGRVRPDPVKGHEHFGYADGVSQPGVRGLIADGIPLNASDDPVGNPDQAARGQNLLWPGEFLFGHPSQNQNAAKFTEKGADAEPPVPFMKDGAYLVFRRLAQLVPEFNSAVKAAAAGIGPASDAASAELLGAQMVGRWKSGAPIIKSATKDNPELAEGTPDVNNFKFGEDREGLVCPWAAHIRKTYPRDDVRQNTNPTDGEIDKAEAFNQTRRMLRRGITFGPELTEREALSGRSNPDLARGLLFKCYVTSLEDQFEFVQIAWVNSDEFSQKGAGVDAIIGQSAQDSPRFVGAAPLSRAVNRKPEINFGRFVKMEGGEYFFSPSIPAIRAL
jgi:Dyp-type peroxidase family